jgi:FkbM family methyltransferase
VGLEWANESIALHRDHGVRFRRYRSARQARLNLVPGHVNIGSGLVVDLGANAGDWTANVCEALPNVRVLAVEPLPDLQDRLAARLQRYGDRVMLDARAVDAQAGQANFNITRGDVFASLLRPHTAIDGVYGSATEVINRVTVPVATLDEIVGGVPVSVLKIDVQGAELRVLAGGTRTLASTQAVLVEMNLLPHYEGGSTYSTVHEVLADLGFLAWGYAPPARASDGRILWWDMCYARPAPS